MPKRPAILIIIIVIIILVLLLLLCSRCSCGGDRPDRQDTTVSLQTKEVQIDLDAALVLDLTVEMQDLLPVTFETEDGRGGWAIRIPGNRPIATPAYADGRLYVGGGYASHEFYCLDAITGEMIWQIATSDDGPTAAVIEDGYVAFNTESCTIIVVRAEDGELVWEEWLGDPLMSQPAVCDGKLYIAYPAGMQGLEPPELLEIMEIEPLDPFEPPELIDPYAPDQPGPDGLPDEPFEPVDFPEPADIPDLPEIADWDDLEEPTDAYDLEGYEPDEYDIELPEDPEMADPYAPYEPDDSPIEPPTDPVELPDEMFVLPDGNIEPPAQEASHRLLCADLRTGEHIWEQPITSDVITAPVVAEGKVYVTCFDGASFCFNADTGELIWQKKGTATSAPLVLKGQIFQAQRAQQGDEVFEGIQQMDTAGNETADQLLASGKASYLKPGQGGGVGLANAQELDAEVGFGTAPQGAQLDKASQNVGVSTVAGAWAYQGSRVVAAGDMMGNAQGNNINWVNAETGHLQWRCTITGSGVAEAQQVFTPPSLGKKRLYLAGPTGHLLALEMATGETFFAYQTGHPIVFQPSLADGRVFVGTTDGLVICLETGDDDADGWPMWGGDGRHNLAR